MYDNSTNKDFESMDIDFHDLINDEIVIISLKENLIRNNIKDPFFDYYKYLKMTTSENNIPNKASEDNKLISKNETISEIDNKEQINKTKVNLFFILYNGCDYKDEYKEIIINRYIKAKRLIIQNYWIKEGKIQFDKKQYRYMKIFNKQNIVSFIDGSDVIIVDKPSKKIIMTLNKENLLSESEFIAKNKNVKNIKDDIKLLESKTKERSQSVKSMNIIMDSNSSKESINNMDNNTMSMDSQDILSFGSESKELDDSDKEIKGIRFYSQNKRYIFLDLYSKEIDGIFTLHNKINIIEGQKDLMTGLKELLPNNNKYDINNDIKSHIIYKNFDDSYIKKDEPFILEVKKSMDTLPELLNQIKNISKVVKNLYDGKLPSLIIGIICCYSETQVKAQQSFLKLKKGDETFLDHIINIIKENKVHVIIGAIKDEQILNYPLGIPDFDIEGKNLQTRIDIFYMNDHLKKLSDNEMDSIYKKYTKIYESLTYEPFSIENYDKLLKNNKNLKETITKMEKDNSAIQQKYNQMEKEKNDIQQKYNQIEKKYNQMEKDNIEKNSIIENLMKKLQYYESNYPTKNDEVMDKKEDNEPNSKKDY